MSIYSWSTTASDNATADANINWQEGQLPSTINNSARATMAALAAWLRDMAAYGTVGGTGNAITLTLNQTMASLGPGIVSFIATAGNTGAVTLNVDGLGAKPFRPTSGVDFASGDIVSGRAYIAVYTTASSGQWICMNFGPTKGYVDGEIASAVADANTAIAAVIPSGTKMLFQQTSAPTGWTKDTTHNNKALRVVSGTASSGGTVAFTTAFASKSVSGTVGDTTLDITQIPAHTHDIKYIAYTAAGGSNISAMSPGGITTTNSSMIQTEGGGGSHTHTFTGTAIDLAVQYVDIIICQKD